MTDTPNCKQKMVIELEVPEGFVLKHQYRPPQAGEWFYHNKKAIRATVSFRTVCFPILRREWEWPWWLTVEWLAMDENGEWFAHETEPWLSEGYGEGNWYSDDENACLSGMRDFQPPPCTDWRASKKHRPDYL